MASDDEKEFTAQVRFKIEKLKPPTFEEDEPTLRITELEAERDRLLEALAEIREIYAGSEGIPVGETAAEAYVVRLLEQMFQVAVEALAGGEE